MFIEVSNQEKEAVYAFCKAIGEEGLKMSFADVDHMDEVVQWIENPREHLFAHMEAGRVIALVKARQGETYKSHSVFMSAAVAKEHRGKRLVQDLSDWVYPQLKDRGIVLARAYVYSDNHSSIAAALRDGYRCTGAVHMHHFDQEAGAWVDDMIFHKEL